MSRNQNSLIARNKLADRLDALNTSDYAKHKINSRPATGIEVENKLENMLDTLNNKIPLTMLNMKLCCYEKHVKNALHEILKLNL